ncbi:MAG TPA: hypothetical protein PLA54_08485 [Spirochaetota bacterium]|nr:hypothetical protein [Spirochaetota bacterium]
MQTYREEMTEVLEKAIRSKCSSVEFDKDGKYSHTASVARNYKVDSYGIDSSNYMEVTARFNFLEDVEDVPGEVEKALDKISELEEVYESDYWR